MLQTILCVCSQLHVQWYQRSKSLKYAIVEVFTLQKLANTTNQAFFFSESPMLDTYQHTYVNLYYGL